MTQSVLLCFFYLYCIHNVIKNGTSYFYATLTNQLEPLAANKDLSSLLIKQEERISNTVKKPEPIPKAPKIVLNNRLIKSMDFIRKWLHAKNSPGLLPLHNSKTISEVARNFLIELFSEERKIRLRALSDCLYTTTQESKELADSLAVLIMWSFAIPDTARQSTSSNFQQAEFLLVEALTSSRDSFVFDFVLCSLIRHDLAEESSLESKNIDDKYIFFSENLRPIYSYDVDVFMETDFIKQNKINKKNVLLYALQKLKNRVFSIVMGWNISKIKLAEYEEYIESFMLTLNGFYAQLRKFDTNPAPPIIEERFHGKLVMKVPLVQDNPLYYKTGATFEKDIAPRHGNPENVQSKLESLSHKRNANLLCTMNNYTQLRPQLDVLRSSLKNLVSNITLYESYSLYYEKIFVAGKLYDFCTLFEFEFNRLSKNSSPGNRTLKEIKILGTISKKSINLVWCLRKVYQEFLKLDDAYSKNEIVTHIEALQVRLSRNFNALRAEVQ